MDKTECLSCAFYDEDYEDCELLASEKWYFCPLDDDDTDDLGPEKEDYSDMETEELCKITAQMIREINGSAV